MGKQSRSPRSGWRDITNGGAEGNTTSVLLPSSLWQRAGWKCYKVQISDPNLKLAQAYWVDSVGDNRALRGVYLVLPVVIFMVLFWYFFYEGDMLSIFNARWRLARTDISFWKIFDYNLEAIRPLEATKLHLFLSLSGCHQHIRAEGPHMDV